MTASDAIDGKACIRCAARTREGLYRLTSFTLSEARSAQSKWSRTGSANAFRLHVGGAVE